MTSSLDLFKEGDGGVGGLVVHIDYGLNVRMGIEGTGARLGCNDGVMCVRRRGGRAGNHSCVWGRARRWGSRGGSRGAGATGDRERGLKRPEIIGMRRDGSRRDRVCIDRLWAVGGMLIH